MAALTHMPIVSVGGFPFRHISPVFVLSSVFTVGDTIPWAEVLDRVEWRSGTEATALVPLVFVGVVCHSVTVSASSDSVPSSSVSFSLFYLPGHIEHACFYSPVISV